MKKVILALFFLFIITGMLFSSSGVFAREDNDSNSGSSDPEISDDSDSDDSEDAKTASFSSLNETERERLKEMERERLKEEIRNRENIRKEFSKNITAGGERVKIEREIEIEDGKTKVKIKKIIISANGTERKIEIEIQRDEDGIARKIKLEGENVSIGKEIEINDLFEGNESNLEAVLSNGNNTQIKVLPERAREIVLERLKARNITNISLEEIKFRNIPRAVYNAQASQNGRFLGVFKLALKSETKIDSETGEVLEINRPWWAFMVSVPDESGNETSG